MNQLVVVPALFTSPIAVLEKVKEFLINFNSFEVAEGGRLVLLHDKKSDSYYFTCHLSATVLTERTDLEAALDSTDSEEIYKLNRDFTEDPTAYKAMEKDAMVGRSFEDMVIEYDTSYRKQKPLKVYGGQHRLQAITKSVDTMGEIVHGIRVYFCLSREQKVEIATVNNTSITVPNDLLDRMQEQLIGSELRDWCQSVNLLSAGEDFADKRSPDVPTVRIIRTLLVNFFNGIDAKDNQFHQPIICKSGGIDDDYLTIRKGINWQDVRLQEMGKAYARLHHIQKEAVSKRIKDRNAEFARKALSMAVVAGWAYGAGYFQRSPVLLQNLYNLPDSVSFPEDPLNAKGLSLARMKGTDPDTYRGLGTRNNPPELGRMLEVFLIYAEKASKKRITKELANAAIQSYVAKKATNDAEKAIKRI